jgi:hypothetical protein
MTNIGRPRTIDYLDMAKKLDAWSKLETSTAFCQFADHVDTYQEAIYEWKDKDETFAYTLKKAQTRLAIRLRKLVSADVKPYNYGLFMREISFHDKSIHNYEQSLKEADHERAKDLELYKHKLGEKVALAKSELDAKARSGEYTQE